MIVYESVNGCVELYLYMELYINIFYTCQIHLDLNWPHGKAAGIKYFFDKALTQIEKWALTGAI